MDRKSLKSKVLVIGLDGATWTVIKPLLAAGELPVLKRIMTNGSSGPLKSTIHPYSAPAWSSFMTGMNPGKHGIFDFTYRKSDSYDIGFVNAYSRRARSLWRILSDAKLKVGILNVPITYPPEAVNGFLISGLGGPGVVPGFAYPAEIFHELKRLASDYIIEPRIRDFIRRGKFDQFLGKLKDGLEKRFLATTHFMQTYAWDFFMIVFGETDQVQHWFWKYMDANHPLYKKQDSMKYGDAIFQIYRSLDSMIGKMLAKLDETIHLIVLSDHGLGGNNDKSFYINNWLAKLGLLQFKDENQRNASNGSLLKKSILIAKKYFPRNFKDRLRAIAPLRSRVESIVRDTKIDWSNTKAYSDELRGNIWINLAGREPQGIVANGAEYEGLRDFIIDELYKLKDPETHKPVVNKIYKREEIYTGESTPRAADIIFLQKEDSYHYIYRRSNTRSDRQIIAKLENHSLDLKPNASHRLHGIIMLQGHDINAACELSESEIIDVAPTILYLLDVPIPAEMDGKVLTQAITAERRVQRPIKYAEKREVEFKDDDDIFTKDDEKRIKESLEGLGYL